MNHRVNFDRSSRQSLKRCGESLYNPIYTEGRMSDQFENVTVIKKANVYFDGKVTSRTVLFPDGSRKTLGFMLPGEYEFNTAPAR